MQRGTHVICDVVPLFLENTFVMIQLTLLPKQPELSCASFSWFESKKLEPHCVSQRGTNYQNNHQERRQDMEIRSLCDRNPFCGNKVTLVESKQEEILVQDLPFLLFTQVNHPTSARTQI